MIHNYYQQRGGEDESFSAEVDILRQNGEDIHTLTVHNDDVQGRLPARVALETVWNRRAASLLTSKLNEVGPFDIIHFQNTFPLISPAAISTAGRSSAAVIQTLRNYRLLCVNGLFFRDGAVCELCLDKQIQMPGIVHACYRDSHSASATVAAMNLFHRIRGTHRTSVDAFITLSEFARSKLGNAGLNESRMVVKPNTVTPDPGIGSGNGGYSIYVGRLSAEKGVGTLMAAWSRLGNAMPLKIVGDGPLADNVKTAAEQSEGAIEWLGQRAKNEVHNLIGGARVLIFPSEWYETFGRVAIEAYAKGTPVIAARIGAIVELIREGSTGLLFEPGNDSDLALKVQAFLAAPDSEGWRQRARAEFEESYSPVSNYRRLMEIYRQAIEWKQRD